MGYFSDFGQACLKEFFSLPPAQDLTGLSQEYLPYALGALLYMPASEPKILNSFQAKTVPFLVSAAICLEDAVRDSDVLGAEENLNVILEKFAQKKLRGETLPFIFIRVRNFEQLRKITQNTVFLSTLTGFILPKFSPQEGEKYFAYLQKLKEKIGKTLYALPILETLAVIHPEYGLKNLLAIKEILDAYQSLVLNVRLGVTDLSGLYALRRGIGQTCYDLSVIKNFIAQAVHVFAGQDAGYVVSGPVWEYYHAKARMKPAANLKWLRGLIRETKLDRANGLIGKTVIHPSQILPVQSLYAVTAEEYADALDILSSCGGGGVLKSSFTGKMNEVKPHYNWAKKIMVLAKIYGVLNEKYDYRSLIGKSFAL